MRGLERHWYRYTPVGLLLTPLAALYRLTIAVRRIAYRTGIFRSFRVPAPVVVVGNITVGGTGKTPLVAWLAQWLRVNGYTPGIVTRGYGGNAADWPREVVGESNPAEVGDEPVLLARNAGCAVVADPDRVRAARQLVERHGCNVIISDDGLQHYRMARDVELAVIDGARRFGNGWCLPAGPLREPMSRLKSVDACVVQGAPMPGEYAMTLENQGFIRIGSAVADGSTVGAERFHGRRVHAVAGIGNPARFFADLRRLGLDLVEHDFPDHYAYTSSDLAFGDDADIIMTEKDAVKCERLGVAGWYLRVSARPDPRIGELVLRRLKGNRNG